MAILGAHVSVAGGMQNAPGRGREIVADAIQVFTANQNQWVPKPLSNENISGFREGMSKGHPRVAVTHDSYLINLSALDEDKRGRAVGAFLEEMDRSEALGIPYIVFHPGAHMGVGIDEGCAKVAKSLNTVLSERPNHSGKLLVEITAGQGTTLGHNFEQINDILSQVDKPEKMGVCFDTQHAFAAGYDIRTEDGWNATLDDFDKIIGLKKLMAFHINDSKRKHNDRVDRHEKLGKGFLGLVPFWCLVNDKRFIHIPAMLETPVKDGSEYAGELDLLRSLINAPAPEPIKED